MPDESLVAKAIADAARLQAKRGMPYITIGTFVAAEATDANLSQVRVDEDTIRFIPKLESATSLADGDQVLILKGTGLPAIILGVVVGDITDIA